MNEQQLFWSNQYADEYRKKNSSFNLDMGIKGWAKMLQNASDISSILECGCNIGRNINFLNYLMPNVDKSIIEISSDAYQFVTHQYKIDQSFNGPIVKADFAPSSFDLTFTSGVLIHIHPDELLDNMKKLYELSSRYVLMGEYFNRTPVMIEYQGEQNKLFKCDFGKMFIQNFDVKLVDYGFLWGHEYDKAGFDDITWWLFEKSSQKTKL
jgi:pseudaminic acid biosynthesis-associated methylase